MCNTFGNHVVKKLLQFLPPFKCALFITIVSEEICQVARARHGCSVLQRCIDCAEGQVWEQLLIQIVSHSLELVIDPFANYAIQYFISNQWNETNEDQLNSQVNNSQNARALRLQYANLVKLQLYRIIRNNIIDLSLQKFSSNVIEKIFTVADSNICIEFIETLLQSNRLCELALSPFGNYVVQVSLNTAAKISPQQHLRMSQQLSQCSQLLQKTVFGRKILGKMNLRSENI
ncbi:MAG: hypothetical protein EZS28_000258 [Streblomastix strix]|uniref:PUM-HD domain-containing protein n=1 Tax=Streblomastix strix TaxID=222440 RepID=A0A5J4XAN5_9EUKA|nr:MAG: hypothetical protein EZS28_000258 [Streblomastix strix]